MWSHGEIMHLLPNHENSHGFLINFLSPTPPWEFSFSHGKIDRTLPHHENCHGIMVKLPSPTPPWELSWSNGKFPIPYPVMRILVVSWWNCFLPLHHEIPCGLKVNYPWQFLGHNQIWYVLKKPLYFFPPHLVTHNSSNNLLNLEDEMKSIFQTFCSSSLVK